MTAIILEVRARDAERIARSLLAGAEWTREKHHNGTPATRVDEWTVSIPIADGDHFVRLNVYPDKEAAA